MIKCYKSLRFNTVAKSEDPQRFHLNPSSQYDLDLNQSSIIKQVILLDQYCGLLEGEQKLWL